MAKQNLYAAEQARELTDSFSAPGAVFRGTPFWSWNNRLDAEQLCRQLDMLKQMGLGGGHLHSRTGMDTAYLGDDFMACVKACVEHAKATGLLAWLYDEDRWPSGAAGGLVTADPQYRARHLLFTSKPYGGHRQQGSGDSLAVGHRSENGRLLARYQVRLENGFLADYRRLAEGDPADPAAATWYAYLEIATPSAWFNHQTYVDTLNPAAIRRFIEITHERYAEIVGDHFGTTIPAIFTDEPQFTRKQPFRLSNGNEEVVFPFTDDLPDTYRAAYGDDLLEHLPELFWELPDGQPSLTRYRYHDHVADRFTVAFADQIGAWCEKHGIALTGHLMEESTLECQTHALGEAMRSYRALQIPGIDILCDSREYTTAKQAQSAVHQYGRPGVLSELYGVTDWDYDFAGHKSQGDWQAALGITVRVQHLCWVSMAGEAKRDYPASIFYQSPWWREYPAVEDHYARLNAVLTRGRPHVRLAVVHPVESFWLCYGPLDKTATERQEREHCFATLVDWLLFGLLDFDFLSESLLPEQSPVRRKPSLAVGEMSYETVLVPPMRTIRSTTLDRLEAFVAAGGNLLFLGEIPTLVDARPSPRPAALAALCVNVPFSQARILEALADRRDIEVLQGGATPARTLLHQLREEGDNRYLFVCNSARRQPQPDLRFALAGDWQVTLLDTFTGSLQPVAADYADQQTRFVWDAPAHGHLLLQLEPGQRRRGISLRTPQRHEVERLADPLPVTLDEPNALVLDQAEWRVNQGDWQPAEEILRLDNLARAAMGIPAKQGHIAQPWTEADDPTPLGRLELRFTIDCEVAVRAPQLAVEQPQDIELTLDGAAMPVVDTGWWVDEAIRTVPLPDLAPGRHELVLAIRYHRRTNVEYGYLLGDFGVRVRGRRATLVAPVRELAFGDWGPQGLPFYTGNATYHASVDGGRGPLTLRMPQFAGATLRVAVDGVDLGPVAFAPYEIALGDLPAGRHQLDITVFGNRFNTFGTLHRVATGGWVGPYAWRTQGDDWAYEYQLRPLGLLTAPRLLKDAEGAGS